MANPKNPKNPPKAAPKAAPKEDRRALNMN